MITEKRLWDFFANTCLYATLWSLALRLSATQWSHNFNRISYIVFIGVTLGLFLGKSIFRTSRVWVLEAFYSIIVLPWQLMLSVPSLKFGRHRQVSERLLVYFNELSDAFVLFLNNRPVENPIFFLSIMAIIFWSISIIAGFQLVRKGKPWIPLVIATIIMISLEFYHSDRIIRMSGHSGASWYSAVFLFFIICLIGRLFFINSQNHWIQTGFKLDANTGHEMGKAVLVGAMIIIISIWSLPTPNTNLENLSAQNSSNSNTPWQKLQERLSNIIFPLQGSNNNQNVDLFNYQMPLGTTASQGEDLVFSTKITRANSMIQQSIIEGTRQFYWRGQIFEIYENGQWKSSISDHDVIQAEQPLFLDNLGREDREEKLLQTIELKITPSSELTRIFFFPSEPLILNRQVEMVYEKTPDGSIDLASLLFSPLLRRGDSIQVQVLPPLITEDILLVSEQSYPSWVTDKYLQLPSNFPESIEKLSRKITDGLPTPYEQTVAITNYLREEIVYQPAIPVSPPNREPIEWFLFENKEGFCNYIASAEILMLRSIGIPARLAIGYAQGELGDDNLSFVIRNKNRHAWPEVYFENIGWVEFEPTSSLPETRFPLVYADAYEFTPSSQTPPELNEPDHLQPESPTPAASPAQNPKFFIFQGYFLALLLTLIGVIFLIVVFRSFSGFSSTIFFPSPKTNLNKWIPIIQNSLQPYSGVTGQWLKQCLDYLQLPSINRSFYSIKQSLWLYQVKTHDTQTPQEQVNLLIAIVPDTIHPANILLRELHKSSYSPYPADPIAAKIAANDIRSLAVKNLLRQRMNKFIRTIQDFLEFYQIQSLRKFTLEISLRVVTFAAILFPILLFIGYIAEYNYEYADKQAIRKTGALVSVNEIKMHLYCTGTGSPTIILDADIGQWSIHWSDIQYLLSQEFRVCSYDRQGYGWSEPPALPRSIDAMTGELHILLTKAEIPPPYIFISRKFSSQISLSYANKFPDHVFGLILINPQQINSLENSDLFLSSIRQASNFGFVRLVGTKRLSVYVPHLSTNLPQNKQIIYNAFIAQSQFWDTLQSESSMPSLNIETLPEKPENYPILIFDLLPNSSLSSSLFQDLAKELSAELVFGSSDTSENHLILLKAVHQIIAKKSNQ